MKIEVRLNTGEPHSILLHAESDGERKLLEIFDGSYVVTAHPMTNGDVYGALGYRQFIDGVRLELTRKTP